MKIWVIVFAVVIATAAGFEFANSVIPSNAKEASIVTGDVAERANELLTSTGFHGVVFLYAHHPSCFETV